MFPQRKRDLESDSISDKTVYGKISRSLKPSSLGGEIYTSFWNVAGGSKAVPQRHMSKFRAIRELWIVILRIQVFVIGRLTRCIAIEWHVWIVAEYHLVRFIPKMQHFNPVLG